MPIKKSFGEGGNIKTLGESDNEYTGEGVKRDVNLVESILES